MALSRPYDWDTEFVCNECNQILSNDVMRKYTVFDEYMGFFVVEKTCVQCDEKNENAEINFATNHCGTEATTWEFVDEIEDYGPERVKVTPLSCSMDTTKCKQTSKILKVSKMSFVDVGLYNNDENFNPLKNCYKKKERPFATKEVGTSKIEQENVCKNEIPYQQEQWKKKMKKWQIRKHENDNRRKMNFNRTKFLDINQWKTRKKLDPQKFQFEPGDRTYKKLMKYQTPTKS